MKLFRLIGAAVVLLPLLNPAAKAQTLDPAFKALTGLYTIGEVYALGPQQADGKRLVGGRFTRINGTTVSSLVRLDASGALDEAFSANIGTVSAMYKIKGLPSGQYLLGHEEHNASIRAGGISRSQVLRLNADGTADPSFGEGDGPNSANGYGISNDFAAQPDGKVVMVGNFTTYDHIPAIGVVRLTATGKVDATFSVSKGLVAGTGRTVVVQSDGKIVVGGGFQTGAGQPITCLVRFHADGSLDNTFTSPLPSDSYVESVVTQPDGKLLVAGSFNVGSTPSGRAGLVRLLPSGALDPSFTTPFAYAAVTTSRRDPPVVVQPDGKILAIGYFEQNGASYRAVRFNPDGSLDTSFPTNAVTSVYLNTVGVQADGSVLLGGSSLLRPDGLETPLYKLSSTGLLDLSFRTTPQVSGTINAVVRQPDGKLVLGGDFTELNGQPAHQLARLTSSGELDASFSAAANLSPFPVSCLALQTDGRVLAGTVRSLRRYKADGSLDPDFSLYANSDNQKTFNVGAMAVQTDSHILIAGYFSGGSQYSSQTVPLMRLTSSGEPDQTFNVVRNSALGDLYQANAVVVQPDGRIVTTGYFSLVNQGTVTRVVRYNASGALDPSFNNSSLITQRNVRGTFSGQVSTLALQPDGKLLLGGRFDAVNGTDRQQLARLTANGELDTDFALRVAFTGPVNTLTLQPNGRILVGGNFSTTDLTGARNNMTRLLENGQTDESFDSFGNTNGAVNALLVEPDGDIVLAGDFTTVSFQPNIGVVRITAPHVLHVGAPAAVAERTSVWPVPAHSVLHVALDRSAQPLSVELLDALGKQVYKQPVTNAADMTLNVEQLPAGMYLLRVSYSAGIVSRRVAVQ